MSVVEVQDRDVWGPVCPCVHMDKSRGIGSVIIRGRRRERQNGMDSGRGRALALAGAFRVNCSTAAKWHKSLTSHSVQGSAMLGSMLPVPPFGNLCKQWNLMIGSKVSPPPKNCMAKMLHPGNHAHRKTNLVPKEFITPGLRPHVHTKCAENQKMASSIKHEGNVGAVVLHTLSFAPPNCAVSNRRPSSRALAKDIGRCTSMGKGGSRGIGTGQGRTGAEV